MAIEKYKRHWKFVAIDYQKQFGKLNSLLNELIALTEEGARQLSGAKKPLENATYLLLAKALNHVLSMQLLLEKGLLIDAALSTRNALETLLLTQAIQLDATEQYAEEWLKGKQFQPSWARKRLESVKEVKVREIVVTANDDVNKMAYSWLSDITHANLSGFRYVLTENEVNSYQVNIGGSKKGQHAFVNGVLAVASSTLHQTSVLSSCILCLSWIKKNLVPIQKYEKK